MSATERDVHIAGQLSGLDALDQCALLIDLGMRAPVSTDLRVSSNRIPGCQTSIWFRVNPVIGDESKTSLPTYEAESDSLLVAGALELIGEIYDGTTAYEAAAFSPTFTAHISDEVIYPEIWENGIRSVIERIMSAASAIPDTTRISTWHALTGASM